jgi:hypothetical protein
MYIYRYNLRYKYVSNTDTSMYPVPILSQIEYPCIISIINSKCQLFQCRSLLKASFLNRWTRRRDIELASSWTKFGIGQMYILEDWALVQFKKEIVVYYDNNKARKRRIVLVFIWNYHSIHYKFFISPYYPLYGKWVSDFVRIRLFCFRTV